MQLAKEIRRVQSERYNGLGCRQWVTEAWHPGSKLSVFKLTSVAFCLMACLGLVAEGTSESLVSGLFVLLITVVNILVSGFDSFLRKEEIYRRTDRHVLNYLIIIVSMEFGF